MYKQLLTAQDYYAEYDNLASTGGGDSAIGKPRELVCWALTDSGNVEGLVLSDDGKFIVSAKNINGFREYRVRKGNQRP